MKKEMGVEEEKKINGKGGGERKGERGEGRGGGSGRRRVTLPVQEAGMMRKTNVFSGN